MKRKTKYTTTTDAAINRVRTAIASIMADPGTTPREKWEILNQLFEHIQQHRTMNAFNAGHEAAQDA